MIINESQKYTYKTAPKWLKSELLQRYRDLTEDPNASDSEASKYWMEIADGQGGPAYFDSKGEELFEE